jgi:hypothetical protein
MSNSPNFSKNQFLRSADFNTAAAVALSADHDTNNQFHFPGLINPSLASYSFLGMTVTAVLPSPFSIEFGDGSLVFAHGIATNSDTQTYATSFTSLVPASTPIVAYLLASVVTIQQNPITIVGPPQGHPSFSPNFVPYTGYTSNVESLALVASTTPANNITTFELGRTTLVAGQTSISVFDVTHVTLASSLLAPTGVSPGAYFPATVTVGLDGRVTAIATTPVGTPNLTTTGVTAAAYTQANITVGVDGRITAASSSVSVNAYMTALLSTTTLTVPAGFTRIEACLQAAGGGGGECDAINLGQNASGGGGGAGGLLHAIWAVSTGQSVTLSMGNGGSTQATGTATGLTIAGTVVGTANGGAGSNPTSTTFCAGGPGGTVSSSGALQIIESYSGGWGSDGQSATFIFAGNGAFSAHGGSGRAGNHSGADATGFGAGGGGAYDASLSGVLFIGGRGSPGIAWYRWLP